MAGVYSTGLQEFFDGTIIWDGSDDLRVMLVTSSFAFDADHDDVADIAVYECDQYQRAALAGESTSVNDASDRVEMDATDTEFTSLASGSTPAHAVVFQYADADADARLICYCPLTSPDAPDGNNYTINWGANGLWWATN